MSLSRKAFLGALLATCLATPAFAQAEAWDVHNRKFYGGGTSAQTGITPVGERPMTSNVQRYKRVPRGGAGNSKTN